MTVTTRGASPFPQRLHPRPLFSPKCRRLLITSHHQRPAPPPTPLPNLAVAAMGCFLGCFGGAKERRRRRKRSPAQSPNGRARVTDSIPASCFVSPGVRSNSRVGSSDRICVFGWDQAAPRVTPKKVDLDGEVVSAAAPLLATLLELRFVDGMAAISICERSSSRWGIRLM